MGRVKCDHIKRLITLISDNLKRLSLYYNDHFDFKICSFYKRVVLTEFVLYIYTINMENGYRNIGCWSLCGGGR
jgi:hypothetical protein